MPVGHDRKVFACGTIWRGFKSRQHKVVFGVILVPQNNTIMCKHNMIKTSRVYELNVYNKIILILRKDMASLNLLRKSFLGRLDN